MSISRVDPNILKMNIENQIDEYQRLDNPVPESSFGKFFGGLIDSGRERAVNYKASIQRWALEGGLKSKVIEDLLDPEGLLHDSKKLRIRVLFAVANTYDNNLTMKMVENTATINGVNYRKAAQGYGPSQEDCIIKVLTEIIRDHDKVNGSGNVFELKEFSSDLDSHSFSK